MTNEKSIEMRYRNRCAKDKQRSDAMQAREQELDAKARAKYKGVSTAALVYESKRRDVGGNILFPTGMALCLVFLGLAPLPGVIESGPEYLLEIGLYISITGFFIVYAIVLCIYRRPRALMRRELLRRRASSQAKSSGISDTWVDWTDGAVEESKQHSQVHASRESLQSLAVVFGSTEGRRL